MLIVSTDATDIPGTLEQEGKTITPVRKKMLNAIKTSTPRPEIKTGRTKYVHPRLMGRSSVPNTRDSRLDFFWKGLNIWERIDVYG
jgi:hypothetical protein